MSAPRTATTGSGPAPANAATGTRTRTRSGRRWPRPEQWVDLGVLVVLVGVALSGLAASFTGWQFLVVGVVGTLLGVGAVVLCRALHLPAVTAVLLAMVAFVLLGGPLTLRSEGNAALLPGPGTLSTLVDQLLHGWKDLLTTLPPVEGDGPLLVLPWVLGLVAGLLGAAAVLRDGRRAWLAALLPVLVAATVLAATILIGVSHPHSLLVQGGVFTGLALGWLAVRGRRATAGVRVGRPGPVRVAAGAGLLAVAAGVAVPVALAVMDDDPDRLVLREHVEPPFDIGQYPSPLAAFRNYVDLGKRAQGDARGGNVYAEEMFVVSGAPAGTRLRLATLDHWDGMVYGATNDPLSQETGDAFQRVSSVIDNPVDGREVEVRVRVSSGYSGVWLPTVGALQGMEFESGDPRTKAESFRYNLATSTAVVPSGLHPGDVYSFEAVVPDDSLSPEVGASPLPGALNADTGFLDQARDKWTENASTPMERVFAAADHLKQKGRYSDGVRRAERGYHPGHGHKRLSDEFVNAEPMVGNDEQYAAVMALMANKLGVPARVVLGAVVPEDGVVRGEHVEAWVELRVEDGTWRTLPTDRFMSRKPPAERQPETQEPMTGTVVPPPAPIPPPSELGESSDSELRTRMQQEEAEEEDEEEAAGGLPAWVGTAAKVVGVPLLLVALLAGAVVGAKAYRRRRRRTAASVSARFVGGWRELVDHARDLGQPVPAGPTVTRRQQSARISSVGSLGLARRADSHVFGPRPPAPEEAESYWRAVEEERRTMLAGLTRWQRLRAALSLASFRSSSRPRRGRQGAGSPRGGSRAPRGLRGSLGRRTSTVPAD
ncbi:transglutaminase domain-containing protein [Nocardioides solisilvae]|uniref:transglutaminase domain-containing protein n=1 Tax=Nocardioides solisilvae TaxID=1542435 RepID=UPI000D748805|nr:transglutaminase domain-containing protein [Nocardioides solisilvae]